MGMSVGDSLLQREGEGGCRGRFGSTMMLRWGEMNYEAS